MSITRSWIGTTRTLLRNLVDIASQGGNYLLNVGPTAEGIIPAPEVERLSAMGRWLQVNGASVYGTTASPFKRQSWGRCTKRIDADGHTTLYLEVFHWPDDGRLTVPVLKSITRCRLLADPTRTFQVSGNATNGRGVHLTGKAPDPICSVVELGLVGRPDAIEIPLTQAPDGSVRLTVTDAEIQGHGGAGPQVESKYGRENIGYWMNPAATVSWTFELKRSGKFALTAPIAAVSGTSRVTIETAGHRLEISAPNTGAYNKFRTVSLGTVTYDQPGLYKLTVAPRRESWSPINLGDVTLRPVH